MSEGLNKLKLIGAKKIYETTHISRQHVQAILHESFEDISKIQFVGFISILEREYNIKLDDLKSKGLAYFSESPQNSSRSKTVFVEPKREKSYTKLYILIVVAMFVGVTVFSFFPSKMIGKNFNVKELNNNSINSAKKIMVETNNSIEDTNITNVSISDKNISIKDENITKSVVVDKPVEVVEPKIEKVVSHSLVIKPKNKVWMGYINIKTYKKHQTVFKNKFTFDTKKDWIIVFGHGHINVVVDGKLESFNTKSNLRFLYKDGKLTKIDLTEFQRLNRGKTW